MFFKLQFWGFGAAAARQPLLGAPLGQTEQGALFCAVFSFLIE
jgi:hypothetical protein